MVGEEKRVAIKRWTGVMVEEEGRSTIVQLVGKEESWADEKGELSFEGNDY